MGEKALEGTKVLEYASSVSGPYCSKLLADLGAEVIKIERTGGGDEARRRGPFLNDIPNPERSGLFLYLNINKRGITLDPKTQTGRKIFLELLRWADILIEDKPPKEMEELGFTYENLKEVNPALIMTSITPFGQTGPYRDYKAYNLNLSHGAGAGYLTPGGSPNLEREPLKGGGLFDDYTAGLSAAVATLAAFYYREVSGIGQHIDASKQQSVMDYDRVELDMYPNTGVVRTRLKGKSLGGAMTRCKDGYVMPMALLGPQWDAFIDFLGNPDWGEKAESTGLTATLEPSEEFSRHLSEWMSSRTMEEVYHGAQAKRVPMAMVSSTADVMNSPQYKARGFFTEIEHPEAGRLKYPIAPYKFSETPSVVERPAPLLGQHNEEVFSRLLGYTRGDLVRMREAGII